MKTKIALAAICVVCAAVVVGQAVGVEIGVGTEPSVSLAATWEISPSFTLVTSFGVAFGGGVQTGSLNLQTASYTICVEARYNIRFETPIVLPYFGLGAQLAIGNGGVSGEVLSTVGVQVRALRNVYLLGEATVLVPILDVAEWYWRLKLGVGFLLRF